MLHEVRDFIPGKCTVGPDAEVFVQIDRGDRKHQLIALAQSACRNCLQLPHCEAQRPEIAAELGTRGVELAVIGARATQTPHPAGDANTLQDTRFTFDLTYPLTDPRHMLEVIRQGFRSKQLSLKGSHAYQYEDLSTYLYQNLSQEEGNELSSDEVQQIVHLVSRSVLKYRVAQRSNLSRRKQLYTHLSDQEKHVAAKIQEAFIEDFHNLKEAGFFDPALLAQVHKPEFYARIIQFYNDSFDITPGHIREILRNNTLEPLPALERHIAKIRQSKQRAAAPNSGKKSPNIPNNMMTKAERAKGHMQEHAHGSIYTSSMPELKKIVKTIYRENLTDPYSEVKRIFHTVRELQSKHPTIPTDALVHLTYLRKANVGAAIEEYEAAVTYLQEKFSNHPALSEQTIKRFAYTHLKKADDFVEGYVARFTGFKTVCEEANLLIPDYFLASLAEFNKQQSLSAVDIELRYKKSLLRSKQLRALPCIKPWMKEKVIQLYEYDDATEVLKHISRFLNRGYLVVKSLGYKQHKSSSQYDITDNKQGMYLDIGEQLSYFSKEEKEAILASFGLDRIVLGHDVDIRELEAFFGIKDLKRLVDTLLPYTRPTAINENDPYSILEALRINRRDKPKSGLVPQADKQAVNKAITKLLALLPKDLPGFQPLDPQCQKGIELLLINLRARFPRLFQKEDMLVPIVTTYLKDAHYIKELGLSKAYPIALGSSGAFCEQFISSVDDKEWQPRPTDLRAILGRSSAQLQPFYLLRRYQFIMQQFLPQFNSRNLPHTYLRLMAMGTSEKINDRLTLYDKVIETYSPDIMARPINYYCFVTIARDPLTEIKAWKAAVKDTDRFYKDLFGSPAIKEVVLSKRGDELVQALNHRVAVFNKYLDFFKKSPHPSIDDETIKYYAARTPNTIQSQLNQHIDRWNKVHTDVELANEIAEIDIEVRRIIIRQSTQKPVKAMRRYLELKQSYRYDDYIEPSMIDQAFKWSVSQTARSIAGLRRLLKKTGIKKVGIQRQHHHQNSSSFSINDIHDAKTPGVDAQIIASQIDPEAITNEESTLLALMSYLSAEECAAVAAVYQIPWFLPESLKRQDWNDIERVCDFFKVRDTDELEPMVERIVAKLRELIKG